MSKQSNIVTSNYISYLSLIKEKVDGVFSNYILIGHYLNKLILNDLYKEGKYNSIYDLGKSEFNLSETTIKNSMGVASKYCNEDGSIKDDYKHYNFSALVELLPIDNEKVLTEFKPEMTVKQIRDVKKSDKVVKAKGTIQKTIKEYEDDDNHNDLLSIETKVVEKTYLPLDLYYLNNLDLDLKNFITMILHNKKSSLYCNIVSQKHLDIYLDYLVKDDNQVFITLKNDHLLTVKCSLEEMDQKLQILLQNYNDFIELISVLIDANMVVKT